MKENQKGSGKLFIIGGSANLTLKDLLEHAGGKNAQIALVPHASGFARESAEETTQKLVLLGAKNVSTIMPQRGKPFAIPKGTRALYMLGGDQLRLVRLLGLHGKKTIKKFLESGGMLAGSSAGAAAVAPIMIAGGMSSGKIDGSLMLKPGLNLIDKVVVDTHFGERGRFNRLLVGVNKLPGTLGIGLDEDTAVLIRNASALVVGTGHVTLFRPSEKALSRSARFPKGSGRAVEVIALSSADRFSLAGN